MEIVIAVSAAPPSTTARWILFDASNALVQVDERSIFVDREIAAPLIGEGDLYLGRVDGLECRIAKLPEGIELGSLRKRPMRSVIMDLDAQSASLAGRALQLLHWDATHRFCGRCGTATVASTTERNRSCPRCQLSSYPRISPVAIVLVRRGERALLARSASFPIPFFSTLAGFVEAGETVEECAVREVEEEVGVRIGELRYFGSQPWPFPHSLMLGFVAQYQSGEIRVDQNEIAEAAFFAPDAIPRVPPRASIARRMIDAWLAEHGIVSDQP
jgi:NAD+ diphosphatase